MVPKAFSAILRWMASESQPEIDCRLLSNIMRGRAEPHLRCFGSGTKAGRGFTSTDQRRLAGMSEAGSPLKPAPSEVEGKS